MAKNKHLTLSDRIRIEQGLNQHLSFRSIAHSIGKDNSTISKEIRLHLVFKQSGCFGSCFNDCINRFSCTCRMLCSDPHCKRTFCKSCIKCRKFCDKYEKQLCEKLLSPPYVCNGCCKRGSCTLEKRLYSASAAHKEYEAVRRESRTGISISEAEAAYLDAPVSPLVKQGQSIHHIYVNNVSDIMLSEKTLYNYIDYGIFDAKNIDLPRKVRYRSRKKKRVFKVDKSCRIGRSFEDFLLFLKNNPDTPVVQMDSVEGAKGGKVLLTLHFEKAEFMLAFIRDKNTAVSGSFQ